MADWRKVLSDTMKEIGRRTAPLKFPAKNWTEFSKLVGGENAAGMRTFWPSAAVMGPAAVWTARLLLVVVAAVVAITAYLVIKNALESQRLSQLSTEAATELSRDPLAERSNAERRRLRQSDNNPLPADKDSNVTKRLLEAGGAYPGIVGEIRGTPQIPDDCPSVATQLNATYQSLAANCRGGLGTPACEKLIKPFNTLYKLCSRCAREERPPDDTEIGFEIGDFITGYYQGVRQMPTYKCKPE